MGYKFSYNGTTHELYSSTAKITSPLFAYRRDGSTYYVPLLTSRSQTIGDYKYDASYPTRCVRYNNTTYYAAKSRTVNYDIPAGTYSPNVFEYLVSRYVVANNYRMIKVPSDFTITVNGKKISFPSLYAYLGYYSQTDGSGITGTFRYVQFAPNSDYTSWVGTRGLEVQDYSFHGIYVVYSRGSSFSSYSNYPITISHDIIFI